MIRAAQAAAHRRRRRRASTARPQSAVAAWPSHTGIPVGETQAGKGSLPFDHPQNLGAIGVTGTPGANIAARDADLVIAIGTRLSDFTTASKTAFQNPNVRFVNINVAEIDAHKHARPAAALPMRSGARATGSRALRLPCGCGIRG